MSKPSNRGHFTSSIGFVMAAAGSAVGLGNLWKFPYVAGSSGGGIFLVFYVVFILILGIPITLAEISIGRKTQLNTIGAYKSINKNWTFVGVIGVGCAFVILSYYSVVGGWVLKYISSYLTGGNFGNTTKYFSDFISQPVEPIVWHLIFMTICALIILKGVVKGIEGASKILLPALFILIIVTALRSLTLEGGVEGLKFFFLPDFSAIASFSDLANILIVAMGQVFFSLSLGMGAIITYGSYLKQDANLPKNSIMITLLDTLMALLAGVAILPAVFAFGFEPTAGPGLIFEVLPSVFSEMPLGNVFGLVFFLLVLIAAITSAISLLEVVIAYFIDHFKWTRKKATLSMASIMAVIGIFASLSMGVMSEFKIFGMNLFDAMSYLSDKILMPLGGLLMCIFVGYVWGIDNITKEIEIGSGAFKIRKTFSVIMKYIAPALILIIFVMGIIQ